MLQTGLKKPTCYSEFTKEIYDPDDNALFYTADPPSAGLAPSKYILHVMSFNNRFNLVVKLHMLKCEIEEGVADATVR